MDRPMMTSRRIVAAWPEFGHRMVTPARCFNTGSAIERHGRGDRVVSLNVGGTPFITLRSTISQSRVLEMYVARAEENRDLTKDGTVFVDRRPEHFDIILAHLRNKAEGLGYKKHSDVIKGVLKNVRISRPKRDPVSSGDDLTLESSSSASAHDSADVSEKENQPMQATSMCTVQLPKESSKLRDIYLEAVHYELDDLKEHVCKANTWAMLANFSAGGGNPFDKVASMFLTARRLAIAGVGSFLAFFGIDDTTTISSSIWTRVKTKLPMQSLTEEQRDRDKA